MLGASSVDLLPGWWIAVVKQTELPLRGSSLVGVGRSHLNVGEAAGVELVPASPQICQRVLPNLENPAPITDTKICDSFGEKQWSKPAFGVSRAAMAVLKRAGKNT